MAEPQTAPLIPVRTSGQKALILTDNAGVALTKDPDMPSMYQIPMGGAGNADFYLSWNGGINIEAILDRFCVNAAVTVSHTLELYINGGWLSIPAWASGTLDATAAQELNASYPLRDMIPMGTKARVRLAVGGACDTFCGVMGI